MIANGRGRRGVLLAMALSALAPGSAGAQGTPWERQVGKRLERAAAVVAAQGYGDARQSWSGALNADESASFAVALEAGVSYAIVGACDDDCAHLRLVLSRGGSDVAVDRGAGSVTVIRFTPRIAMGYDVKVTMSDCRTSPCWYGIALYRRR